MKDCQASLSPSSSFSSLNLEPLSIDEELWLMAEERTQEILYTIQPNVVSEHRRKEVIDYVQRLIKGYCGTEVFPFGSVPLKTYLPDGDIDLTALIHKDLEEDLARQVCSILESGENSEFQAKDIQYIRAQVKVVRCTVKSIAVDISFNQMAGLCTLCFLEQVDQYIGKNHLFKHSIILIKAWCYYESRILGAHHGLLSTYALETLVLYIINRFHSSLRGPLEVLYRFLEYYSAFDWDNYCVSICGPVAMSSLPEIVVTPECDRGELLFSMEFLRSCRDIFSIPAMVCEHVASEFPIKHLNVMDPLKDSNNLGRSVSKGNFHRIRCALSYGAQKLQEILSLPGERMGGTIENFFLNTLDRNGKGQRPDIQVPVPAFGTQRSEASDLSGDCESSFGCLKHSHWYHNCTITIPTYPYSSSTPHAQSHGSTALIAQPSQHEWGGNYERGTHLYGLGKTFYHPNTSQLSVTAFSVEESTKSRGTGTYIPDMHCHLSRDMHMRMTKIVKPDSVTQGAVVTSAQKRDQVGEVVSETNMICYGSSFEKSIEEFPILPSINKTLLSDARHSIELTFKSQEAECSSPGQSMEFESTANHHPKW